MFGTCPILPRSCVKVIAEKNLGDHLNSVFQDREKMEQVGRVYQTLS